MSYRTRSLAALLISCCVGSATLEAQIDLRRVYVAAFDEDLIYEIDPQTREVTVFADASDGLAGPSALVFDRQGSLLVSNFFNDEVLLFTGPGEASVLLDSSDLLDGPFGQNGMVFDEEGNLYIANFTGSNIVKIPAGGGPASIFADRSDGIVHPDGLAFTPGGSLLVANRVAENILQIEPDGVSNILLNTPCEPFSLRVRSNGDVYYVCDNGELQVWPDGDPLQEFRLGIYGSGINNYGIAFSANDLGLFMVTQENGNLLGINPINGDEAVLIPAPEVAGGVSVGVYRAVPKIEIEGECPGTLTVTVSEATPNGGVGIVRSLERGESFIPEGPCDGTRLQLVDAQLAGGFVAGPDGSQSLVFPIEELNCAGFLQPVDITSCFAGDAVPVDPDIVP